MDDKLKTLKNYDSMVEALFDQELLKENNIESSINNEDTVELLPMFSEIDNGLKIVVFERDYENAVKLLEDYKNTMSQS